MKQILINSEELQVRVAVVEDGRLQDFFMERTNKDRIVGSIYKGRIKNLEPSLQAAFVDIGIGKNAFLHYWDMLPATQEMLEGDGETDDDDELIKPGEEREEANRNSDSDSSYDPPAPPQTLLEEEEEGDEDELPEEEADSEEPEQPIAEQQPEELDDEQAGKFEALEKDEAVAVAESAVQPLQDAVTTEEAEALSAEEPLESLPVLETTEESVSPSPVLREDISLASNLLHSDAKSGLLSLSKKEDPLKSELPKEEPGEAFEASLPENPPPQQEQDTSGNPSKGNRNQPPQNRRPQRNANGGESTPSNNGDQGGRHRRRRGRNRNRNGSDGNNGASPVAVPRQEPKKPSWFWRLVNALYFWRKEPKAPTSISPVVPANSGEIVPLTTSKTKNSASQQTQNRGGQQPPSQGLLPIAPGSQKPVKTPPPPKPKKPEKKKPTVEDIPNLFHVDDEILVQVTKGPIGTKGARVTANLSIPGRYLVLLPNCSHVGVSRRVEDHEERARLKQMVKTLEKPDNMGLICRTVGAGLKKEHFQRDLDILLDAWKKGIQTADKRRAPVCVYQEPALEERTLRDCLTQDIDEIVVDSQEAYDQAKEMLERFDRANDVKLKLYSNPTPIFIKYGISQQIENISNRKVMLPSGGYLCIDETEALIAIDVNTGKNRNGKTQPETILETNMEAVKEIARQLRLRNIGGLVVLDLIDMRSRKDQMAVYRAFKQYTSEDHARIKIYPISGLGLLEMSRQRESESLESTIYEDCPYCKGRGLIKTATSVSVEIQRRLNELLARKKDVKCFTITVHPKILARLRTSDHKVLEAMAAEYSRQLTFSASPDLHIEEYHITDKETGKEF
ncbi:MAG: Rne/Rng family ribonuclease [Victivallales bacterium]|nr:Rne/Rng family ribonuclease [Victivallales bacterium]